MIIFLIFTGLAGVWLATQVILYSANEFAKKLGWSEKFIGLVILAVGTDLPELAITLDAAFLNKAGENTSGLIFGNIIGSCITQIGLALGLIGIISGSKIQLSEHRRNFAYLIGSLILLGVLSWDGSLSKSEGLLLIGTYLFFFFQTIILRAEKSEVKTGINNLQIIKLSFILLVGLGLLHFSADMLVSKVLTLSEKIGISQSAAGLLIIGAGTSLPEIAVSIGAGLRKNPELAVSNLIGSNILDTLLPLGLASLITTLGVEKSWIVYDLAGLVIISLFAVFFLVKGFSRKEGITIIAIWVSLILLKSILFNS